MAPRISWSSTATLFLRPVRPSDRHYVRVGQVQWLYHSCSCTVNIQNHNEKNFFSKILIIQLGTQHKISIDVLLLFFLFLVMNIRHIVSDYQSMDTYLEIKRPYSLNITQIFSYIFLINKITGSCEGNEVAGFYFWPLWEDLTLRDNQLTYLNLT